MLQFRRCITRTKTPTIERRTRKTQRSTELSIAPHISETRPLGTSELRITKNKRGLTVSTITHTGPMPVRVVVLRELFFSPSITSTVTVQNCEEMASTRREQCLPFGCARMATPKVSKFFATTAIRPNGSYQIVRI